jgi:type 1 glutamine amidotransferase|tara:strand:+ start:141 stop:890 length:750 start_codon:yes stop_codon:yes gene_type:complete
MEAQKKINVYLVAGGKYHDIDYARLEILKLLAEDERIRTKVGQDYKDIGAITASDFLITYTCDVMPSLDEQEALREYVSNGGKWYALHGTNSILRFLDDGQVSAPRWAPHLMETLGSQFISHPPIAPYMVEVANAKNPLVKDVEPFEVTDELYLMDIHGELDILLHTEEWGGTTEGFVDSEWESKRWPVFYIHKVGKGSVLYLTLGHCRGHYDMDPITDFYPEVEKGSWDVPVFYDLLRRGISWCKGEL